MKQLATIERKQDSAAVSSEHRLAVHRPRLAFCVLFVSVAMVAWLTSNGTSSAFKYVECQHPVRTGVEVFKLHNITSSRACPVALKLFRWEATERHESQLYGCHGIGHPYLRKHTFAGWHLALKPAFVMSRSGMSFAVGGTDFPVNCT